MSDRLRRAATPVLVVASLILMFAGVGWAIMTQPFTAYTFYNRPDVAAGPALALLGFIILLTVIFAEARHAK